MSGCRCRAADGATRSRTVHENFNETLRITGIRSSDSAASVRFAEYIVPRIVLYTLAPISCPTLHVKRVRLNIVFRANIYVLIIAGSWPGIDGSGVSWLMEQVQQRRTKEILF